MPRPVCLLTAAVLALAGCSSPPQGTTPYAPSRAMLDVLRERVAMHAKHPGEVSISEARDIPSVTDAAQAIPNAAGLPAPVLEVKQFNQLWGSGAEGAIGASLYRPALAKDTPLIIYFPGGTWVTRSDVAADETARQLALRTGWIVLSVRPRLAPEAQFPSVHDDAFAFYQWARANMREWGADPTRVVLAGEGPGANLALSTALAARDREATGRQVALPDQLLLITPWASTATSSPSMSENAGAEPLDRPGVRFAQRRYAAGNLDDRRIDLASRQDFQQMPPTLFILADIDPLRSGAETLAQRMQTAGVRVDVRRYRGVTYDFFGLGAYVPEAAEAEADAADAMRRGFSRSLARR